MDQLRKVGQRGFEVFTRLGEADGNNGFIEFGSPADANEFSVQSRWLATNSGPKLVAEWLIDDT